MGWTKSAFWLFALLLAPISTRASPAFSGSFTGIGSFRVGPFGNPIPNTPISGTFSDDPGTCTTGTTGGGIPAGAVHCYTPALTFTFAFLGQTLTFSSGQGSIFLSNPPGQQVLELDYGYSFQTEEQVLILSGPPNAFVDNGNLQTLHPGPVNLATSFVSVEGRSSYGGSASLTSVTFNAVPEPSSLAALLSAIAVTARSRRRRPSPA